MLEVKADKNGSTYLRKTAENRSWQDSRSADFVSVFGKLVKTINRVVVRKGRFTPSQLSSTLQLFTVIDHRRLSSIDIYARGCERSLFACMLKL